jgi:hypothetical protein
MSGAIRTAAVTSINQSPFRRPPPPGRAESGPLTTDATRRQTGPAEIGPPDPSSRLKETWNHQRSNEPLNWVDEAPASWDSLIVRIGLISKRGRYIDPFHSP